jgi:hypothetical protein
MISAPQNSGIADRGDRSAASGVHRASGISRPSRRAAGARCRSQLRSVWAEALAKRPGNRAVPPSGFWPCRPDAPSARHQDRIRSAIPTGRRRWARRRGSRSSRRRHLRNRCANFPDAPLSIGSVQGWSYADDSAKPARMEAARCSDLWGRTAQIKALAWRGPRAGTTREQIPRIFPALAGHVGAMFHLEASPAVFRPWRKPL